MKKILFLLSMLPLSNLSSYAQAPGIQWAKCYGGSGDEAAYSVQQTFDGGYVVAGYSNSFTPTQYWILTFDSTGTIEHHRWFGGTGGGGDYATSILQTPDSGFIIAGYSGSSDGDVTGNHGGYDYWVVKLDKNTDMQWEKSYGSPGDEEAYCIRQCVQGGYIVAGTTGLHGDDVTENHGRNDYWIVKIDDTGAIQWQKSYGGSQDDYAYSIKQTRDSGYIIAGYSKSADGDVTGHHGGDTMQDVWVVKINDTGAIQWQKSLGGTSTDVARDIVQVADGYVLSGATISNDGDVSGNHGTEDLWVVKLDDTGHLVKQKCFGGSASETALSMQQTSGGKIVLAGLTDSYDGDISGEHGYFDFWVIRIDDTFHLDWQKCMGGSGPEVAWAIQLTNDGGYIVAGQTQSDNGEVSGYHGGSSDGDFWVVKLAPDPVTSVPALPTADKIAVYPNPAQDVVYISANQDVIAQLTSIDGRVLATESSNQVNISQYLPGIYLLNIYNRDAVKLKTEKITKY